MSIISKETWDNIPENEKKKLRALVSEINLGRALNDKSGTPSYKHQFAIDKIEEIFGKENLQEPKIKTWDDMIKQYPHFKDDIDKLERDILYGWNKLREKLIACYKIAKLIEHGYGGRVTEEEWKNTDIEKYCVYVVEGKIDFNGYSLYEYHFIAFRTSAQREEFMSYPDNKKLVEQYYMM